MFCVRTTVLGLLILLPAALLGDQPATKKAHVELNPLYRELLDKGVALGAKATQLPGPTMADDVDAKQQQKVLAELARDAYPLDELTRNSLVAPHIFKVRDIPTGDAANLGRGVDLWFIAFANLESVSHDHLLALYQGASKNKKMTALTEKDLRARGIQPLKQDGAQENYFHTVYPFLDRLQVKATSRNVTSRTKESLVLASRLEPIFNNDKEFPNQWRPLDPDEAGRLVAGAAHPYEGSAVYIKVTQLKEPKGALLVEYHQVFAEPRKWFAAPNLLKSKLPIVVQAEVRAFRRQLAKLNP